MIGVRGSGGSAPITDATATASDIVSGKVAYNNNGRIVGTHTESGTVITDATASADDIVYGKVAYNNYGRIVGTHTESGIVITDATASADDIAYGKVAYGNYGRIVGTHTESGTVITDATANASDVLSGKVFYNNSGRHVGTLELSGKSQHISIPAGKLSNFQSNVKTYACKYCYPGESGTSTPSETYANSVQPGTTSSTHSVYKIAAISFDISKMIQVTTATTVKRVFTFPTQISNGWHTINAERAFVAFLVNNNTFIAIGIMYTAQTMNDDKLKQSVEINIQELLP